MRILVTDGVLADPSHWNEFEALLDCARRNRCYLDALNPASVVNNPWLTQATKQRQQTWFDVTNWAAKDAAIFRLRTLIADLEPGTSSRTPKIALADAIELVGRSVSIWLENGRNDRRFLLAMMPKDQREMVLTWEQQRIYRFENGGGLGELRKALEELSGRGALDPHADRALFDSDSEVPGHPSSDASLMITFCASNQISHHCLTRRAIENYLPLEALWSWARNGNDQKTRRVRIIRVQAYTRMSSEQKAHFHMKTGWGNHVSRRVHELYADISDDDRKALQGGIDGNIASLYQEYHDYIYEWSSKEGIDANLRTAIDEMIDWIRVPYA